MAETDAELLRQFAIHRSQAAFAKLTRRHIDFVFSVALRRVGGDAHSAEDVVQRVFIDLARKAPSLLSHPSLVGWLFTGTRLATAQLVRTEQRRQMREQEAQIMHDLSAVSPPEVDNEELRLVLDDVVSELNSTDREAVLLRFFEGNSFAEVGAKLRLSEEGARSRVDRALEKLRVLLGRRQITSTGAALTALLSGQAGMAAPAGLAATVAGGVAASATGSSGAGLLKLVAVAKSAGGIAAITTLVAGVAVAIVVASHRHPPLVSAEMTPVATATLPQPVAAQSVESDLQQALAYDEGKNVARNPQLAAQWYQRAADQGAGLAELQLGIFAETGDGLPQDYTVARGHYRRALDLGVAAAGLRLGIMNLEGWGGDRDVGAAVALFTQAAEAGDRPSEKILSNMYFSGFGVKADLHQALAWQERAAKNDDPEAEAAMGSIVRRLYTENTRLAREWYQLSAEQDYTKGMLGMAETFLHPGAPPDQVELGRQWLEMAAKDGNGTAAYFLAGFYLLSPAYAAQPGATDRGRELLRQSATSDDPAPNAEEILQLASSGQPLADAMKYVLSVPPEQRYVQRFAADLSSAEQNPSGSHPPVILKMVQPVYPEVFRLTGAEGDVWVDFTVDPTGRVRQARVTKSSHPEFSRSALLAVQGWRFLPACKDGHLVSTPMRAPLKFRLSQIHDGPKQTP